MNAFACPLQGAGADSSPAPHLQLGADVLTLQLDRAPLDHLEVPGTEDFDGQVPSGAAHTVALPEGAVHAAARGRVSGYQGWAKAGSAGGAANSPVHQQDAGDEEGDPNTEHVGQRHVVWERGGCEGARAVIGAGGAGVVEGDVAVVAVV